MRHSTRATKLSPISNSTTRRINSQLTMGRASLSNCPPRSSWRRGKNHDHITHLNLFYQLYLSRTLPWLPPSRCWVCFYNLKMFILKTVNLFFCWWVDFKIKIIPCTRRTSELLIRINSQPKTIIGCLFVLGEYKKVDEGGRIKIG